MTHFETLKTTWQKRMALRFEDPWLKKLNSGDITLAHYKGYLLETYFYTAYNPQLQMFAAMYLKNNPRDVVSKFCDHAKSEVAHDLLAKSDLMNLGVDELFIDKQTPLATTTAFFATPIYQIQFGNPLYYLGYLFHLEFAPTQSGQKYVDLLHSKGIPKQALTFMQEHVIVDAGHNRMMEQYVTELIVTNEDLKVVSKAIEDTCDLYMVMIQEAFKNGEKLFG